MTPGFLLFIGCALYPGWSDAQDSPELRRSRPAAGFLSLLVQRKDRLAVAGTSVAGGRCKKAMLWRLTIRASSSAPVDNRSGPPRGRGRMLAIPRLLSLVFGENPDPSNPKPGLRYCGLWILPEVFTNRNFGLHSARERHGGLKQSTAGRGGAPRLPPAILLGAAVVDLPCR
jgi:hypothetical protein